MPRKARLRFSRLNKTGINLQKQGGAALYLMMLTFVVLILPVYTINSTKSKVPNYSKILLGRQELKHAKENLLAMAVNYADNYGPAGAGPGHFPCPNTDLPTTDRSTHGPSPPCGQQDFVIGRLPRITSVLYSSKHFTYQPGQYNADQAFWYAVSGGFVNNPLTSKTIVNPESETVLRFDSDDGIVALIIDPGNVLYRQIGIRPTTNPNAYLESANADGDAEFNSDLLDAGNDRIAVIRKTRLMKLLSLRVLAYVSHWLIDYRNSKCTTQATDQCFPFAALNTGECQPGMLEGWIAIEQGRCNDSLFSELVFENVSRERHWFIRNQWHKFIRYHVSAECLTNRAKECKPRIGSIRYNGEEFPLITVSESV